MKKFSGLIFCFADYVGKVLPIKTHAENIFLPEAQPRLDVLHDFRSSKTMKKYYRPPQEKYSEANLKMAKDMGYHTFFWSLAYVDWYENKQPTHEEAFKKLLGREHPGAIVLLHSTSKTNGEILDELLTKWEEMGYRFGTLDELTGNA